MNGRILFFDQYGTKYGGAQYILIDIIEYLLKKKIDVSIALPNNNEISKILLKKGVDVYHFENFVDLQKYKYKSNILYHLIFSLVYAFQIKNYYNNKKIKIIYCNGGRTFILGLILSYFLKSNLVYHIHLIFTNKQKLLLKILGKFNRLKKIIVVSEHLKSQYLTSKIYKKILVINNWPNFKILPKKISRKTDSTLKIIVLGRISEEKGQLLLINNLSHIDIEHKIMVSFVGSFKNSYVEEIFSNKIKNFKNKNIVLKFKGYIENIEKEIINYNFLLQPSITPEAQSLVLIEAFASNVIVISNNIPNNKYIIKHGHNGLLYEAGNEKSLNYLFQDIYQSKYELKKIQERAYKDFQKYYSKDQQLKKIYNNICNLIKTQYY